MNKTDQIKAVIFDFDNTLFDTEKIKLAMYGFAESWGFSPTEAEDIYQEARGSNGQPIKISLVSFSEALGEHLKKKQKIFWPEKLETAVGRIIEEDSLLAGATDLLGFCQQKNLEMCLLSLGVKEWQEEKVNGSKIGQFFEANKIFFTDDQKVGKVEMLKKIFGGNFIGSGAIIFNDKPDETRDLLLEFPQLIAFIRIEERDLRYQEKDFENLKKDFPNRVFASKKLTELKNILKRKYVK